ncbi:MAG: AI-2E family transporter [Bacteroidota bacterium]
MNNSPLSNWRHYFPLFLVGIISVFLLFELNQFLNAFLGAIIMYVLLRPLMQKLILHKKWKHGLAAITLMIGSFIIILMPILGFSYLFVSKMSVMFNESSFFLKTMNTLDQKFQDIFGKELLSAENLKTIQEKGTLYITQFLGETLNVLADIGIMYFVLYYMLVNTGKLEKAINKFIPMERDDILLLGNELKAQTNSNAIGAPLLALIQGTFAWIGYLIFGIEDAFFWGMMTGFFSFIPFVGSALIWGPAAIYQFTFGATWQGIGIVLFGILVIGTIDNVFRFVFQRQFADVHPVITVFGVIIGLQLFGVPGVIFGPLLLSWFLLLIKIYRKDYPVVDAKTVKHVKKI